MDLSNTVPLDIKAKKASLDLELSIDAEIKRLWGTVIADYKNSMRFIEWLCCACVSMNKHLDEPAQKAFILKLGIRTLSLTAPEQQRFIADVDYLFEKGLVKRSNIIMRVLQLIFRIL